VARALDVKPALLAAWECGEARPSRDALKRWTDLLSAKAPPPEARGVTRATPLPLDLEGVLLLREEVDGALAAGAARAQSPPPAIGPTTCLEEELQAVLSLGLFKDADAAERRRTALSRLWGWDGQGGTSYTIAGLAVGVTPERVRQVARELCRQIGPILPDTPWLDRALEVVRRKASAAEAVEAELVRARIVRGPFRIEGVLSAGLLLRRQRPALLRGRSPRIVVPPKVNDDWLKAAGRLFHKAEHRWGGAPVSHVVAGLRQQRLEADEELVRLVLVGCFGAVDLGEDASDWLALPSPSPGTLWRRVRKALTMLRRVEVDALHHALTAAPTRALDLPYGPDVLLALARRWPGVDVDGTSLRVGPTYEEYELDALDRLVVAVVHERGTVREQDLLARGLGKHYASVALAHHPFLVRTDEGFALRGQVPPSAREVARVRKDGGGRALGVEERTPGSGRVPTSWVHTNPDALREFMAANTLPLASAARHFRTREAQLRGWLDGARIPSIERQLSIRDALDRAPAARAAPGVWTLVTLPELQEFCRRHRLTANALARRLGVAKDVPRRWLAGVVVPTLESQRRIRQEIDAAR